MSFLGEHYLQLFAERLELKALGLQHVLGEGILRHQLLPGLGQPLGSVDIHSKALHNYCIVVTLAQVERVLSVSHLHHVLQLVQLPRHLAQAGAALTDGLDDGLIFSNFPRQLLVLCLEHSNLHILHVQMVLPSRKVEILRKLSS